MAKSFDPYHKWLGIPPAEQPPNFYRLLGIKLLEDDPDVISNAADQKMVHLRTFKTGQRSQLAEKLLNEISAAKIKLLKPDEKAAYDAELKAESERSAAAHQAVASPPPAVSPPPVAPVAPPRPIPVQAQPVSGPPPQSESEPVPVPSRRTFRSTSRSLHKRKKKSQDAVIAIVVVAVMALGLLVLIVANSGKEPDTGGGAGDVGQADSSSGSTTTVDDVPDTPPRRVPDDRPPFDSPPDDDPPPDQDPERGPPDDPQESPFHNPMIDPLPDPVDPLPDVPEPAPTKPAVPDDSAQTAAVDEIRGIFKNEIEAAKTPDQRLALARKLLQVGDDTAEDLTARYVFFRLARDVAAQAGDVDTTMAAADRIIEEYDVDALEFKVSAFANVFKGAREDEAKLSAIVESSLQLLDEAVMMDDFQTAKQLRDTTLSAARNAENTELVKDIVARTRGVENLIKEYTKLDEDLARLEEDADDPEANLALGRFHCLLKGDFETGLSMLAKGSDAAMRAVAEKELAQPRDAAAQVAVGDGWWELAELEKDAAREKLQSRAALWYRRALPDLQGGIDKVKVEQRLESIAASGGDHGAPDQLLKRRLRKGLISEFYNGNNFQSKVSQRVFPSVDLRWWYKIAPNLPRNDISVRWTGYLALPAAGDYTFTLDGDDGFRMWLDGKQVIDHWSKSGRAEFSTTLEAKTPYRIMLEHRNGKKGAHLHFQMRETGQSSIIPVPPQALFHEPGQDA